MNFTFNIPTTIHFGRESLKNLIKDISKYNNIGIIYDHNLKNHPILLNLFNLIEIKKINFIKIEIIIAEPTYSYIEEFRKNFMEQKLKAIIGIGGGSTLDTAKAIAVLINNKKPAIYYRGFEKMTEKVLPIYAVPTTAGTGSEITPNASFVDSETKKKLGINGEAIRPKSAYLHPGFIETCPERPASYAGIDALIHALEAFSAKNCTLPGKMFSITALNLIINNIVPAIKNKDKNSIEKLFWGSTLAAAAMMHSGTGPIAALSYPLGVHCKVPHGLAGAVFLKKIIKFNIDNGYLKYSELPFLEGKTEQERCLNFLKKIEDIYNQLNLPDSHYNVGFKDNLMQIFLKDLRELKKAIEQNPVNLTTENLKRILEDSI